MYESRIHTPASGCSVGSGKASLGSSVGDNRDEFTVTLMSKLATYQDATFGPADSEDQAKKASEKVTEWKLRLANLLDCGPQREDGDWDSPELPWDGPGDQASGSEGPGMGDLGSGSVDEATSRSGLRGEKLTANYQGLTIQTETGCDSVSKQPKIKRERPLSWDQFMATSSKRTSERGD